MSDESPPLPDRTRRSVLRASAGALTLLGATASTDPAAAHPQQIVRVDGREHDGVVEYELSVTGDIAARAASNANDRVSGSTVRGTVGGWYDEYAYVGRLESFDATGPVGLSVDGREVDPETLPSGDDGVASLFAALLDPLAALLGAATGAGGASATTPTPSTPSTPANSTRTGRSGGTPGRDASGDAEFRLEKLGQTTLSESRPGAGFAETRVRHDGRYALVGTKFGAGGTHLVDLRDPGDPVEVHALPSDGAPNPDVKFGRRDGLYYRSVQGGRTFDVVDYGHEEGTPSVPVVVGSADTGTAHNLEPHPEAPVVYTVTYDTDPETPGFAVWDVSDPTSPRRLGTVGPSGTCHDVTVDARRDLLHVAYQGGEYVGYVSFDASDPRRPTEVGRFSYAKHEPLSETGVDEQGFASGHHAEADPRRDLVVMGDEVSYGVPGGKHVFDVGWGEGSPADPRPLGYVVSPNARRMSVDPDGDGDAEPTERWDWTGHDFDHVPRGDRTLLVSGDWHEGVVLYDFTDPTAPRALDRHATDDRADEVTPNATLANYGDPPWAWNAEYCPARDLVVAGDQFTGVYTFEVVG